MARSVWRHGVHGSHAQTVRDGRLPQLGIRGASVAKTNVVQSLENEPYVSLATFRRSGAAVETPVWFCTLDGRLYVVTDGTSAKVKRLRATKRFASRSATCAARCAAPGTTAAAASSRTRR